MAIVSLENVRAVTKMSSKTLRCLFQFLPLTALPGNPTLILATQPFAMYKECSAAPLMLHDESLNDECLEPNQLLAEKCTGSLLTWTMYAHRK